MTTLYGIKNCDSVKKARKWLEKNQIDYQFHDFRSDGITENQIGNWIDTLGWETLINKRSTTWKELDSNTKDAMNAQTAIQAILAAPTLIKRPLIEFNNQTMVGFKADIYQNLLLK